MVSPTIRKVRACFGEAKKKLFSPIQECLTSLPSVIEVIASYYTLSMASLYRNIFIVYKRKNIAQFFSSMQYIVAVHFLEAILF